MYKKTLNLLTSKDQVDKKMLSEHGIDEDAIINGIKHYSTQIRYSRLGVTVENSIKRLAEKINARIEKFIDGAEEEKTFDKNLKNGAPTQEEQKDFAQRVSQAEKQSDEKKSLTDEIEFDNK